MAELESLESLQRAYAELKLQIAGLQQEWQASGVLEEVNAFETEFLEEQTAKELGVAGAVALGLTVAHSTMKAVLPAKTAIPLVSGIWMIGGAFIIFRITASTAVGWAAMTQRNANRRRALKRKLESIQRRIDAMTAEAGAGQQLQEERSPSPELLRRNSPSGSTGSSVEFVEAPGTMEEGLSGQSRATEEAGSSTGAASGKKGSGLDSWRQYASLGRRKSE